MKTLSSQQEAHHIFRGPLSFTNIKTKKEYEMNHKLP